MRGGLPELGVGRPAGKVALEEVAEREGPEEYQVGLKMEEINLGRGNLSCKWPGVAQAANGKEATVVGEERDEGVGSG